MGAVPGESNVSVLSIRLIFGVYVNLENLVRPGFVKDEKRGAISNNLSYLIREVLFLSGIM